MSTIDIYIFNAKIISPLNKFFGGCWVTTNIYDFIIC